MRAIQMRAPSSELVQQQIAGDLEEEITDEENTREKSELLAGDTQLLIHRQRCKPNVDPVNISNDVQKKDKGKNPAPDFLNRPGLDGLRSGISSVAHVHLFLSLSPRKILGDYFAELYHL